MTPGPRRSAHRGANPTMSIFDQLRAGVGTTSAGEMQVLAAELARALPDDSTLALHGDLGAGKTTFVQGLARGLGITEPVTSPTFTLYTLHRGPRSLLIHLDAYRLANTKDMEGLMLDDFMVSPYCLAIEWPGNVGPWLPANAMHLDFSIKPGPEAIHHVALRPV